MAARVAAWHNRHLLARRVSAEDVHGIGEVVLPFCAPPAPAATAEPLRRRAWSGAALAGLARVLRRGPPLGAAFSERFIDGLSPRAVARWARRHGEPVPVAPADWPRRVIVSEPRLIRRLNAQGLSQGVPLHVLTAAIGVGGRRVRVLLDARGAMLGARIHARARAAVLALAVAMLAGAAPAGIAWLPLAGAAAEARAPAASTAPVRAQTRPATVAAAADPLPVAAPTMTAAPDPAGSAPPAAPVARPTMVPIDIRPVLGDEERRIARETGQRLRGGHGAGRAAPAAKRALPATAAKPARQAPVYALVAPPTRRRDDAMALLARTDVLRTMHAAAPRSEVIAAKGMWRAALWPYLSLADAERARVVLAGRGVKAEVVEF